MRALILVAGAALAIAACNSQSGTSDENIMINDGDDAFMKATIAMDEEEMRQGYTPPAPEKRKSK